MRSPIILLLLLTFFFHPAFCQTQLVFIGTVSVKGADEYTYKLQVTDSAGILKGFSITDIMGPNETKTAITGTLDTSEKEMKYRETKILSTKSNARKSDFCFIHANLKLGEKKGITTLKGHFTGYLEDGKTVCADGRLTLLSAEDVLAKLSEIKSMDSIKAAKNNTQHEAPEYVYKEEKEVPESSIKKVKQGDTITLTCPSPAVTVDVWDAKTIDGDIVTILQDNNAVLENYTLSGIHKQTGIMLANKTSILTLIAVSEGSEPLNTARLKITSGEDSYYIDATTTIGKNVVVILKRK